jgi:NAD(P)-dependent dehydrogenase (short-subunit alcohol dehydrogenase family)
MLAIFSNRVKIPGMHDRPVAIITGGGRGIGAACARKLAERGYALVLMSLSDSAPRLAAELGGAGISGSVSKDKDLRALVDLAIGSYGRIDAVISSTGHPSWARTPESSIYQYDDEDHLLDIPDEEWHNMLDVLVLPAVRLARLVTPQMRRQRKGAIVNISGLGAAVPATKYPFGAMIRHALVGFAQIYTAHYARFGIRMNNVLPGFMDNIEWSPELARSIPAGRPGTLDELAGTIAFLLSDEAAYISGRDLLVDGGAARTM